MVSTCDHRTPADTADCSSSIRQPLSEVCGGPDGTTQSSITTSRTLIETCDRLTLDAIPGGVGLVVQCFGRKNPVALLHQFVI